MLSSSFAQCYFKHDSNVTDDIARTDGRKVNSSSPRVWRLAGAVQCSGGARRQHPSASLGLARP